MEITEQSQNVLARVSGCSQHAPEQTCRPFSPPENWTFDPEGFAVFSGSLHVWEPGLVLVLVGTGSCLCGILAEM